MIRFDKIRFVTPLSNVSLCDNEKWQTTSQNGEIICQRFKQMHPCLIVVEVHYPSNELTVEFTGKILKDDYPMLISRKTIRKCLDAVNEIGVCVLDIDKVLSDSTLLKCDVTNDIVGVDISDLKNYVTSHITNNKVWKVKSFPQKNNIVIEKEVSTARAKRRMTIYDKHKELERRTNLTFLEWVHDPKKILSYFSERIRFELNLVTCRAIMQELDVDDCSLITVLDSTANPLSVFFNNVLFEDTQNSIQVDSMRMYDKLNTLIVNNWDLNLVEQKVRQFHPNSFRTTLMNDYRNLKEAYCANRESKSYDFISLFDDEGPEQISQIVDPYYWDKFLVAEQYEDTVFS